LKEGDPFAFSVLLGRFKNALQKKPNRSSVVMLGGGNSILGFIGIRIQENNPDGK